MKSPHPFFTKIQSYPKLQEACRMDLTDLPVAYRGKNGIRAILLGADPTNGGLRNGKEQINFTTVFGIGEEKYETAFFGIHKRNLRAVGLTKDDCYIQNVCRNYFKKQTSENKMWFEAAQVWLEYLEEELSAIDPKVPVLATCGQVFKLLTNIKGPYTAFYSGEREAGIYSKTLQRTVYPFFRGRAYQFVKGKWDGYASILCNLSS